MELDTPARNALLNRIGRALRDEALEFEVNFGGFGVSEAAFKRVLNALSTSDRLEKRVLEPALDMRTASSSLRLSLVGRAAVTRYCQSGRLEPDAAGGRYEALEKTDEEATLFLDDHGLRANLRREKAVDPGTAAVLESFQHGPKQFRYKQRVSFSRPDDPFRVDCTIVNPHARPGNDVASAGVFRSPPTYEIEVELAHRAVAGPPEACLQRLTKLLELLYKNLDNSPYVTPLPRKQAVLAQYLALTGAAAQGTRPADALRTPNAFFVGPKPVSLTWEHLLPPDPQQQQQAGAGKPSVLTGYTVTDKADGERALLLVADDGRCYVLDSRLDVRYTGIQARQDLAGTLLDGEYVDRWLLAGKSDLHSVNMAAFMAFDIYFLSGKPTSQLPLVVAAGAKGASRAALMQQVHDQLKGPGRGAFVQFRRKAFAGGGDVDVFEAVRQVLSADRPYETDGLIFTPAELPVGAAGGVGDPPVLSGVAWPRAMKWKPPEQNTIDFLVRLGAVVKDGASLPGDAASRPKAASARAATLLVGHSDHFGGGGRVDPLLALQPAAAVRLPKATYREREFAQTLLQLDDNGRLVAASGDPIQNDQVVEFGYVGGRADGAGGRWTPLRVRHDKTQVYQRTGSIARTANDFKTATSIWRTIVAPVTLGMLTGDTPVTYEQVVAGGDAYYLRDVERDKLMLRPMLDFHNHIKAALLQRFKGAAASLFDVGVGMAGDLSKWMAAGFKTVVGVDRSEDGLLEAENGAYARLLGAKARTGGGGGAGARGGQAEDRLARYVFAAADAGRPIARGGQEPVADRALRDVTEAVFAMVDKSRVKRQLAPLYGLGNGAFDVVSCQFAVHYFFKSEATLDAFCANVASRMRKGGHFVGTCMDGVAVTAALARAPGGVIQGKKHDKVIWVVKAKGRDSGARASTIGVGREIEVFVESINNALTEYVVDFELLTAKLAALGVELQEHGSFRDFYAEDRGLSEDEATFSFLNQYFVFVKA